MPRQDNYDLQFRPASYFGVSDHDRHVISQIKGERRRQIARELLAGSSPEELDHLDSIALERLRDSLLAEELSEEERETIGKIHPSFMGGEFLPSSREEEVEIARIALESTTADVISIRARQEGEKILYDVVDEYESEFQFEPRESELPLTMGELIRLIDQAEIPGYAGEDDYEMGLTDFFRNMNLMDGQDPTDLIDFVVVSSEFYAELEDYYRDRAKEWAEGVEARRSEPR